MEFTNEKVFLDWYKEHEVNKYPKPAHTVDNIIFAQKDRQLHVLLIKRKNYPFKGKWAFPGGFVDMHEDLEVAALRELEEETGATGVNVYQLGTWGKPERDPRMRVISTVYVACVEWNQLTIAAADDALDALWFAIEEKSSVGNEKTYQLTNAEKGITLSFTGKVEGLPIKRQITILSNEDLAFDHAEILLQGLDFCKTNLI